MTEQVYVIDTCSVTNNRNITLYPPSSYPKYKLCIGSDFVTDTPFVHKVHAMVNEIIQGWVRKTELGFLFTLNTNTLLRRYLDSYKFSIDLVNQGDVVSMNVTAYFTEDNKKTVPNVSLMNINYKKNPYYLELKSSLVTETVFTQGVIRYSSLNIFDFILSKS